MNNNIKEKSLGAESGREFMKEMAWIQHGYPALCNKQGTQALAKAIVTIGIIWAGTTIYKAWMKRKAKAQKKETED